VTYYFASDIHLRRDHPESDRRFSAWVERLMPTDSLVIVGDLCDFWMGTREMETSEVWCESFAALAAFRRHGGRLSVMAGNHDAWLCPFYALKLGAQIIDEPCDLRIHGLRVRLVHGHLLGARKLWKGWMESRAFFQAFGRLPEPVARNLEQLLEWKNRRHLIADEERHLSVYREYASACRDLADIVVIGHVHRPVDEPQMIPRLVVLGGWQHRSSYLRIDETGVSFHVEPGTACARRGEIEAPRLT
jgi:UDP-2,3-diacylglucosamine hydrolase